MYFQVPDFAHLQATRSKISAPTTSLIPKFPKKKISATCRRSMIHGYGNLEPDMSLPLKTPQPTGGNSPSTMRCENAFASGETKKKSQLQRCKLLL